MSSYLLDRIKPEYQLVIEKFTQEYPVKVGALAKELGLRVVKSSLSPRISGQIGPCDDAPSGFEIKVNRYETLERQRFTIAHEIAHFLLHKESIGRGIVDNLLYRSSLSSRMETEANKVAAELIMPRKLIRSALTESGSALSDEKVESLAGKFKVSVPAMKVRLGVS